MLSGQHLPSQWAPRIRNTKVVSSEGMDNPAIHPPPFHRG